MSRFLPADLAVLIVLIGNLLATGDKEQPQKDASKHTLVTITKIDTMRGEITVKFTDEKGKERQKTFPLTREVKCFDETGRVVAVDVFELGNEALILTGEAELRELRLPARVHRGQRLSDALKTLIELTDCEEGCVEEIQRIYGMLRKLDTDNSGKINLDEVKAERDRIVEERVKGHFDRLDTSKDGRMSKEEAKGLIKEHFDRIDRNQDGFLDRAELLRAAKEKHAQTTPRPEKE